MKNRTTRIAIQQRGTDSTRVDTLPLLLSLFCLFGSVTAVPGQETPFRVSLWGEDRSNRLEEFRATLEEIAGDPIRRLGFSEIEVQSTGDYERRLEQLFQGNLALVEVDPATYFVARRRRRRIGTQPWQYEIVFQNAPLNQSGWQRATIMTLAGRGIEQTSELRGRILGIRSPYSLTAGGVQMAVLKAQGLQQQRQYSVVEADSIPSLCKALFSGLVDAIAVTEGSLESFVSNQPIAALREAEPTKIYRSDPLPALVWCIHRRLVRDTPELVARISAQLSERWEHETLLPSKDNYYLTTTDWVEQFE